ncbi:MAG: hypothetical protein IPK52_27565 [Chloroflexi bacterium]|nr:hypothetical protein [Chloroflexota bacterium]
MERLESVLENWGLYYPYDDIRGAFQMFVQTNYQVLPNGGGYFDQDPYLMRDFMTLLTHREWIKLPQPEMPKLGNMW